MAFLFNQWLVGPVRVGVSTAFFLTVHNISSLPWSKQTQLNTGCKFFTLFRKCTDNKGTHKCGAFTGVKFEFYEHLDTCLFTRRAPVSSHIAVTDLTIGELQGHTAAIAPRRSIAMSTTPVIL